MYGYHKTQEGITPNGFCDKENKPSNVIHFKTSGQVQCRNCGSFEASLGQPLTASGLKDTGLKG